MTATNEVLTVLIDHITSWLRVWEELLDAPHKLVVDDTAYNVLLAAPGVLQEWVMWITSRTPRRVRLAFDPVPSDSGFKGDLVLRLRAALPSLPLAAASSGSTVGHSVGTPAALFDLLTIECSGEISRLATAVHQQPTVDATAVISAIRDLTARLEADPLVLTRALERELRRTPGPRPEHLRAISVAAARRLVLLEDSRQLKTLPEECLSYHGTLAALSPGMPALTADPVRLGAAWECARQICRVIAGIDLRYFLGQAVIPDEAVLYTRVFLLANAATDVLATYSTAHAGGGTVDVISPRDLAQDSAVAEALGRELLGAWGGLAVMHVLHELTFPSPRLLVPEANRVREATAGMAVGLLPWVRTLPTVRATSQTAGRCHMEPAVLEGTEDVVRRALRDRAAEVFSAAVPGAVALALGQAVVGPLVEEGEALGADWRDARGRAAVRAVRDWASRRDVQSLVQEALGAQCEMLWKAFRSALRTIAAHDSTPWWAPDPLGWWAQWLEAVADAARGTPGAWRQVAWDLLPGTALTDALTEIPMAFATSHAFDVVFTVEGLSAEGERWRSGGITWYAASTAGLGEAVPKNDDLPPSSIADRVRAGRRALQVLTALRPRSLAAREVRQFYGAVRELRSRHRRNAPDRLQLQARRRSRLHAWIEVMAPSAGAAREEGRRLVEGALSTATFAIASRQRLGGLRLRLGRDSLVAQVDRAAWTTGGKWEREESASVQPVSAAFLPMSQAYAPLVQRAWDPRTQSDLERRLFRTFAWYREGRWEPNHTTRFLNFYVAFEHLFVPGRAVRKGSMPTRAVALLVSWAFADRSVGQRIREQVDAGRALRVLASLGSPLESALDRDRAFHGWRDDDRPLLVRPAVERLSTELTGILPPGDPTLVGVSAYLDRLRQFCAGMATVDARHAEERNRWRFRLELLAMRRNEVLHEARAAGPDMQLYAAAMEEALLAALNHLANSALGRPVIGTVEDAVAWYATPWLP